MIEENNKASDLNAAWTISRVLRWTARKFDQSGYASARLDAEVLLAHCLGMERIGLYLAHDKPLDGTELGRYRQSVRRRLAGEPVAYITGQREFWSLPLAVSNSVLVPRPETEGMVELAVDALKMQQEARRSADRMRVIDVGTGSGAIAIALAQELDMVDVFAIDVDASALACARRNATKVGVAIHFIQGDLLHAISSVASFDLIIANLPYISSNEVSCLSPEVRDWEPRIALDGGPDGLSFIRPLVAQSSTHLVSGGRLMLEIDRNQGPRVEALLRAAGFDHVSTHCDLSDLPRVVQGTLTST